MKSKIHRLAALCSVSLLATWPAIAQTQASAHSEAHGEGPQATASADSTPPPGMLGVEVQRISDELRYQLPLIKPGAGLIVRGLLSEGPAAQAKIEKLDILLLWNDQLLVHPAQLQVLAQSANPGDTVDLGYLHHGVMTHSQVVLAASASNGRHHRPAGDARTAPLAGLSALLGSDVLRQAADALAGSGIDANAVAGLLKGGELGKFDPSKLDPAALLGGKIAVVAPDGTRREITLSDIMQANGNIGELIKGLDLGNSDPASLLGSKIFLMSPNGTQTEINPAMLLKSAGAIGGLLKGLGQPPAH